MLLAILFSMNETGLSQKVLKYLNSLPQCKAIKIHGSRYQEVGTPDIICCYHGHMILIELKVGKEEPSDIQLTRIEQWQCSEASAYVCWSLDHVKYLIQKLKFD